MRHIQEHVVTFEVQENIQIEGLELKKGDKVRYQGSVSNNTLYLLKPDGRIDHENKFPKELISGKDNIFKVTSNF